MDLSRRHFCLVFSLLIITGASPSFRAQEHSSPKTKGAAGSSVLEDDSVNPRPQANRTRSNYYGPSRYEPTAMLTVQLERRGVARVMLSMPGKLKDPSAVHQALSHLFSFPLTIDPPRKGLYNDPEDHEPSEYAITLIEAHNDSAFAQQVINEGSQIRPASLAAELKSHGIKTLHVTILFLSRVPNLKVSGADEKGFAVLGSTYYEANISTENPGAAIIDLSWGYSRGHLWKEWPLIAAFILVPMLLTIWMGRRALKLKDHPTEMWGRYFRYFARVINSLLFVWVPVYAWANLGELIPVAFGPNHSNLARVVATAAWIVPPVLVMWLCHLLSGQVYRNVRGAEWSPADVVRRFLLGASIGFLPLFFLILIINNWSSAGLRNVALLIIVASVTTTFLAQMFRSSLRSAQYSVTRGELRDRVFELAQRAGVKLKQIYVLPEGKAQLSNAFARSDNVVMLTASLLRHLNKREVDAVMGHEIGHLKEKHPRTNGIVNLVTLMIAGFVAGSLSGFIDVHRWAPVIVSLAIAGSIFFVRFIARGNERHADAIGISLTGDPEALISSLAKISRLNLMPMHEGSAIEFGTHPKTLDRLRDIARVHGISPDRFQILIAGELDQKDHYRDSQVNESRAKAFSTELKQKQSGRVRLAILGVVLVTPVLSAWLLAQLNLQGAIQLAAYLGGALAIFLIYQTMRNFIPLSGLGSVERALRAKISQRGFPQAARDGVFVGLGPASEPRRYERSMIWDVGLLWFVDDRMLYLGEEAWFALNRSQVVDTRIGWVEPAFLPRNLLYLDWRDEALGSHETFYLTAASARSILKARRAVRALNRRIEEWLTGTQGAAAESAPSLRSPAFGEITSEAAKTKFNPALIMKSALIFSITGSVLSLAFGLQFWSACYAIAVVIALSVVDELPKLFFGGLVRPNSPQPPPPYQRGAWAQSGAASSTEQIVGR